MLGRTLKLNGVVHTIIGVVPREAEFPGGVRLWVPFAGDPNQTWQSYGFNAVGRLKPGLSVADAEKDLLRAQQPIWDARDKERIVSPYAKPLHEQFVRDYRSTASTLLAAVGLLLFIACANVASVMLARALARRREMGIRLAVGASRLRLARQLFVENLVLAALGGLAGLALGRWALSLLLASAGNQVPQWANFELDARVVFFSIALSGVTALLFGWAPALHAVGGNLRGAMSETSTGTTGGLRARRTLHVLVGAEFALAAVLLVCGGLLLRAYDRVRKRRSRLPDRSRPDVLARAAGRHLRRGRRQEDPRVLGSADRTADRAPRRRIGRPRELPAARLSLGQLLRHRGARSARARTSQSRHALPSGDPGYFKTMGIRLKAGRFFVDADGRNGNLSIIVNETFVRTFWPGVADPVGRRIRGTGPNSPWMTVVGMTGDVRHYGLERPMRPGVYLPLVQSPNNTMAAVIRTAGDPAALTQAARGVVREIDPDLALYRVHTMEDALRRSMAQRALYSWLLGVFAAMALVLALGGAYGVTSYLVSQRTREIGIRVALGARRRDITATVLRGSLIVVGTGIVVGIAASVGAARLLSDRLFGVPPHDASILSLAAVVLLTAAVVANWLPARRAARVDPMRSLRAE